MLFDEERPLKKPASVWELTQILANVVDRRKELLWHRSEVAGGDYIWSNEEARLEYNELGKKRKAIMSKLVSAKLD